MNTLLYFTIQILLFRLNNNKISLSVISRELQFGFGNSF